MVDPDAALRKLDAEPNLLSRLMSDREHGSFQWKRERPQEAHGHLAARNEPREREQGLTPLQMLTSGWFGTASEHGMASQRAARAREMRQAHYLTSAQQGGFVRHERGEFQAADQRIE